MVPKGNCITCFQYACFSKFLFWPTQWTIHDVVYGQVGPTVAGAIMP